MLQFVSFCGLRCAPNRAVFLRAPNCVPIRFFCYFSFTKSCGSACFVFAFFFVHLIRLVFCVLSCARSCAVRVLFSDCLRAPNHVPVRVFLVSHFFLLYNSLNRVLVHFFVFFSCTKSYPTSCHCDNIWAKHK